MDRVLGVLAALGSLGTPAVAVAQSAGGDTQQIATRRQLLDEAQRATAAGDHARALDLAQRAGAIQMTPSVRMFIADEQFALRDYLGVRASASACHLEAERDTLLRNREVILAHCAQLESEARGRTGTITLRVASPRPPGLRVRIAGAEVPEAQFGAPYAVAVGEVVVEATREGGAPFRRTLSVAAGAGTDVAVEFGASSASTVAPGGEGGGLPTGGVVVAGIGVLSLGAAGVFAGLRADALSGCTEVPGGLECQTVAQRDRADSAGRTFTYATDVALGVGAAALIGGGLWILLGRGGHSSSAAAARIPQVTVISHAGGGMVLVGGGF